MPRQAHHTKSKLASIIFMMGAMLLCTFVMPVSAFAADNSASAGASANAAQSTSQAASATSQATNVTISQDGKSADANDASFAISDFTRSNRGTAKTYNDQSYGYRFQMAGNADNAFEAIVTSDAVIVYVPQAWSSIDHAAFQTMLQTLDAKAVSGATTLKSLTLPYVYTSQTTYTHGSYTYNFGTEVEPGYYYAIIRDASGNAAPASVAQFAEAGTIADASNVNVTAAPTGIAAIGSFFSSVDMRPFWVSMRTSLVAMIIIFILGLLAARFSLRMNSRLKGVLDSLFTIPMVLPPTVCGFLLLVIFGNSSPIGRWLVAHGIALVFTWPAAVIAATVVGFPLMYRTCRGAFEAQDTGLFDAARTLGWSEPHIFFKLMLPLAWPSIAAGTVLAFARAMGEFGATLFFAGNYAGVTQTMPIAIYYAWIGGDTNTAVFWVVVTILISFIVILLINWYAGRSQKYRRYSSADGKHGFTAKAKEAGDVTDDSGYTDAIGKSPLVALTFDGTVGDKQ